VADGRVQVDTRAIEDLLYHRSGLLGVSGISSDTRTLLETDDPAAVNAGDLFCYRISREFGALEAIVFNSLRYRLDVQLVMGNYPSSRRETLVFARALR
jgi:acetate kinase